MAIALPLLVSAEAVIIQQFRLAIRELSIFNGGEYVRAARCWRRGASSVHFTGSRNTIVGAIENLLGNGVRLGIRFVSLSEESKSELQHWLSEKRQAMLPEFVARKFQNEASQRLLSSAVESISRDNFAAPFLRQRVTL